MIRDHRSHRDTLTTPRHPEHHPAPPEPIRRGCPQPGHPQDQRHRHPQDQRRATIGGLYALERIAHDSPRDQSTVMEVLAAFVREHSRERRLQQEPDADTAEDPPPEGAFCPTDVQAAVTVVGRRNPANDHETPAMRRAGPDFHFANLARANLFRANLARANLARRTSHMRGSSTRTLPARTLPPRTSAVQSSITRSSPEQNSAEPTSPARTFTKRTSPARSSLTLTLAARSSSAPLSPAHLYHANLGDIDLGFEDLTGADLTQARYSLGARVPDGWAVTLTPVG